MASTSVYSIRIDTRVKKMIEEMPDIDWQEEIRILVEQAVKKRRKEALLTLARNNQEAWLTGPPASIAIREDRDRR